MLLFYFRNSRLSGLHSLSQNPKEFCYNKSKIHARRKNGKSEKTSWNKSG